MSIRIGNYTVKLDSPVSVKGFAGLGSKKESEGPMAQYFDVLCDDSSFGEMTWEKAESRMQKDVVVKCLDKAGLTPTDINFIFAGDLLNQCIGSTYGLRDLEIPFIGAYGACSTMAETLCMAAAFIEGKCGSKCVAVTSSHFCSAERQFRFPLEYGGQRPQTSQWTATAAGACVLSDEDAAPYITEFTIGKIVDYGITDANNMGAAMAPAAAATIKAYFDDTGACADGFDAIITGDLGYVGSNLLYDLLERDGLSIKHKHTDCGLLIYDREKQDVHAGGSGCGCSASILCSYFLPNLKDKKIKNILFCATGALMSPTSVQQGESIPGIAHAVHITNSR